MVEVIDDAEYVDVSDDDIDIDKELGLTSVESN